MPSIKQEPLDLVLSHYDLQVSGTRNESYKDKKGVWWVHTPAGNKILKKISNSEDTLKYTISTIRHLNSKGMHIPAVIPTKTGKDYVTVDGTCYILLEAVDGRNPNYDVPSELAAIVRELARFHKASAGYSPAPGCKPKIHLGTWVEDYTAQLEDMERFYKEEAATGGKTPFGKYVIQEFPHFRQRALNAIEGLKGREYGDWVTKAGQTGSLCHQDFAAGNLLLQSGGKMYVIDTDSITIDIPARDIRKLFNKVMKKKGKWDPDLTARVLSAYQKENPLTPSEWRVVKYDLMFPHLFIGAMNKYYYQRDKEWSPAKYLQRLKEMSAMEKTIEPVLQTFDSMIPV